MLCDVPKCLGVYTCTEMFTPGTLVVSQWPVSWPWTATAVVGDQQQHNSTTGPVSIGTPACKYVAILTYGKIIFVSQIYNFPRI